MVQEQVLQCLFCKKSVTLTPFGLYSKHIGRGKRQCCGSGYTPEEASSIVRSQHVQKETKSKSKQLR